MDGTNDAGAAAGAGNGQGAAATGADAGAAGAGQGAGAGAQGAASGADQQGGAQGAAGGDAGASLFNQGAGAQGTPTIPEKYVVKKADGSVDIEASALKLAGGYAELHKRFGAGEAPPADIEGYKVDAKLPEGVNFDELKKDPQMQGFLKRMHAKGASNAIISEVMDEFYNRVAPNMIAENARLSFEDAKKELGTMWADDATMEANLKGAMRAVRAFAGAEGKPGSFARLEKKFANDADFMAIMAAVGKDIREDRSAQAATTGAAATDGDVKKLMESKPYWDSTHADHEKVKKQVADYYTAKYAPQK